MAHGDQLVQAVAAQNNNTMAVINAVGPVILESWVDHPNVTAVVWAGLGGTEVGNALVKVMYGAQTPSGRLPYTIAKSPSDYPAQPVDPGSGEEIFDIVYAEGCVCFFNLSEDNSRLYIRRLFVDYRHFDAENITPRFEFDFGLSYTTFEYSALSIDVPTAGRTRTRSWRTTGLRVNPARWSLAYRRRSGCTARCSM